ncbi:MAG: sel1 repeat family protein [Lachnospiraceae bacterium]|nr:sel1 repeat family protein [Lachnospiraceae bacterium]
MSKRRPFIFMTQDKLIDLCRYDIGWIETVGGSDLDAYPESGFDVQCENEYPMLLSDLKTALMHFEEDKTSFKDFAFDWWCPVTTYFYEDLCLDELLGPDPDNIGEFPLPPLPETDEDMIVTVMIRIARTADNISEDNRFPTGTASDVLGIPLLLSLIDNYEENKELPPEERTYTKEQMLVFLNHWDNDLLLSDAPRDVIAHFTEFTDILCGQHVFEALKIKAFACNGGNSVFKCDYEEAVRLLTILLKEFGFGYAANALGFIYYDGKLNGKPDYDKAFACFAIASNYNVTEAKLKYADMLLLGDAGNPDPILAYNIYLQVYHDARIRFESGDYNAHLPESSLRIARALKLFPDQKVRRLKLLLEAAYSSFVRYQTNKLYTDLEFSREIQSEVDKVINEFGANDAVKINSGWQKLGTDDVSDVFDDFTGPPFPAYYTVNVRKLKSGRYKFIIRRHSIFPDTTPPLSLSVQPWRLSAGLCDNLTFTLPGDAGSEMLDYLADSGEAVAFDKLIVNNSEDRSFSEFAFLRNGLKTLVVKADKIFFNKPSGTEIG